MGVNIIIPFTFITIVGAHQTYNKYYFKKMSQEPTIPEDWVAAELPGRVAL